jgi:predicted transcriptional regulator
MAKQINEWRAKRGPSQRDLAEVSGISREFIARIELDQHDPRLSTLEKQARRPA